MVKRVIIELRAQADFSMQAALESDVARLPGFKIDPDYEPVPVSPPEEMVESLEAANERIFLSKASLKTKMREN